MKIHLIIEVEDDGKTRRATVQRVAKVAQLNGDGELLIAPATALAIIKRQKSAKIADAPPAPIPPLPEPELLACPFCGSEVTLKDTGNDAGYRWLVRCDNALCMVNPFARAKSLDATMAIWNQRAGGRKPAPPETETVKALASATGWASLVEAAKEWRKAEKRHALMELGELGGDSDGAKSIAERKLHAVRIAADKCEAMTNAKLKHGEEAKPCP